MEPSWLQKGDPVDWQDFEQVCATGKEILERLAGDRSLFRHLTFTAHERDGFADAGAWTGDGGEVELFADESMGLFVYLHVGLAEHLGEPSRQGNSYVAKVLTGIYRHVWYSDDGGVSYVADEQPPGLYGMSRDLMHSLSWTPQSTALVLREARAVPADDGGLTEDRCTTLQHRADFAGIM